MRDHGGGLPTLDTGEPVLARWFVVTMLVLVPLALAVTVWAFTATDRDPIDPALRRPPGTAEVTHLRGEAVLAEDRTTEAGPGCAEGVTIVGDPGSRAVLRRALSTVCELLRRQELPLVRDGLEAFASADGRVRVAVFELTGVDSSARVDAGRPVIELNAKFQFDDAIEAAPSLAHELAHFAQGFPGDAVDAAAELAALQVQAEVCGALNLRGDPPRGCLDAAEVLAADDPLQALIDAGFEPGGG